MTPGLNFLDVGGPDMWKHLYTAMLYHVAKVTSIKEANIAFMTLVNQRY